MKPIGRKLVLDWGNGKIVAIEILVREQTFYTPAPKKPQLFDIFDILGERIEKLLDPCAAGERTHGQDMNGLMPAVLGAAWMTQEEWDKFHPPRED